MFFLLLKEGRETEMDRPTDRRKSGQTDGQTDRQTDGDRQADRQTNGLADKKMARLTDVKTFVSRQRDRTLPIVKMQWLLPIPITAPDHLQVTTHQLCIRSFLSQKQFACTAKGKHGE